MSAAPAVEAREVPGRTVAFLAVVGLICGFLTVVAFQVTLPRIRANQLAARQQAVFKVLPGAQSTGTFRYEAGRFVAEAADAEGGELVFAGYDAQGALVGVAVEASAMGYQDTIRLLYGYDPSRQVIVGVHVLESRETPGLGDRVESDADFLANFVALDVALDPSGAAPLHPLAPVAHGTKTDAWQIDCITGATVSSKAVTTALRDSAEVWPARLVKTQGDLQRSTAP